jgi:hypothetical protein
MSCVLRASGRRFAVDEFLAASPLRPEAVFRTGEPVLSARPGGPARGTTGFNLEVSSAGGDDLATQVDDATRFLDEFEDELRRLGAFEGVEIVFLDFGVRWTDAAVHIDTLPADLLWRAGALDISITVSHHPHGD